MAETSAGSVVYTVDVETSDLLRAQKVANDSLSNLQKGFDKTDAAASKSSQSIGRLGASAKSASSGTDQLSASTSRLAASVRKANTESSAAAQAIGRFGGAIAATVSVGTAIAIIQAADAYGEMAERIEAATSSSAEYSMVQRRLLDNANATYRPLVEAQELFVRTADTLRGLGYTTSQALDITDSLSLAFVRNSASGQRAESAIAAVSASLQKGKVDADAWATILAAVPTIVTDLANSTGKATNEIRQLGAEGKLTGQMLAEGLRKGHDDNAQAAADMAVTVKDAYNNLINTLTVYIGEANKASGASGGLAKALEAVTKGFRETVGMLDPQVELNKLLAERISIQAALAKTEGTWRENLPPQVEARKRLATIEERMRSIQDERIAQLKEEKRQQDALASAPAAAAPETDSSKALSNLKQQAELARLSGEARAKLAAIQKLGNEATEAERVEAQALAAEIYRLETARKAESKTATRASTEKETAAKKAADAERKGIEQNIDAFGKLGAELAAVGQSARDVAMQQAELSLNQYATPEQVQQVRDMAGALYDLQNAKAQQALLGQMDPVAGAQISFEDQLSKLQQLNDAKLLSDQRYLELKAQAEAAYDEQSRALQEENFRRQSTLNALMLDGIEAFGQGATTALAGIASGTFSAQEAFQSLANTILQAGVGALVQLGVQALKTALIQQTAAAAAASAYAVSVAAQVSTTSALAAQAAYASTAAIPIIGPAAAPAAAATAGAAAASLGAPAIASAAGVAAGGRLYGGSVAAGEMYRVNENGAPEIYSAANGQQFMMPNQRGEVISNADATGGAGVVNYVTITIDSGGNSSTDSTGADSDARSLANAINVAVINSLERESRQGGILWQQRQNNG